MSYLQQQMPEDEVDGENEDTSLVESKVPQEQIAEGKHLVTESESGTVESSDTFNECQVATSQQLVDECIITLTKDSINAYPNEHDGKNPITSTLDSGNTNLSSSGEILSHPNMLSDQEHSSNIAYTINQDNKYCSPHNLKSPPDVIHHVDPKTKQIKLQAELKELRNKHLAKPKAARLMTAAPPGELEAFREKQRELTNQWKQSERDARDFLHKYRGDGNNLLLNNNLPDSSKRRNRRESNFGNDNNNSDDDAVNDCNNNTIVADTPSNMSPSRLKPYFEERWKRGPTEVLSVASKSEEDETDFSPLASEENRSSMVPSKSIQGPSIDRISESMELAEAAKEKVQRLVPPKWDDLENDKDDPQVITSEASSKVDDGHRRPIPVADYGRNGCDTKQQISDIIGGNTCSSDNSLTTSDLHIREQISRKQVQPDPALPPAKRVDNCIVLTPQRKSPSWTEGTPPDKDKDKAPRTPDTLLSSTTDESSLQSDIFVQGSSDNVVSNTAASHRPKPNRSRRKKKNTKDDVGFSWLSGIFVTRHMYSR